MLNWIKARRGEKAPADGAAGGNAAPSQGAEPAASTPADMSAVSSDAPIRNPAQDAYGIDGFAETLARSIANANAAEGLVFAINGSWGSGKSSACNLVLHHLENQIKAGTIVPITFNPWWFSGAEALTTSFFQELSVPIGKSVSEQAREILANIGRRVSAAGPLLGPVAVLLGMPGADEIVKGGAKIAAKLKPTRTVEEEHEMLAEALRGQTRKFLVVIDDIDRLGTDEALQMFRLVKSVGRLPNVVYLLAFDRHLAEKMISERFPAEGASYLDKFIQGGFDLPLPDNHDLRNAVLRVVSDVMGEPEEAKLTRFYNLFYDICAPLVRLPRDAVRLSNAIRVTWPAIGADVDRADFLAMESLRLFLPSVHNAIKSHSDMLCGASPRENRNRDQERTRYDEIFLSGLASRERQVAQRAMQRLFPRTDNVWSNSIHSDRQEWHRDRLVCSEKHFATYFGFAVDEEAVTARELQELLRVAADADAVANLLRQAATQSRRRGGTRAALLLEELQVQAGSVPEQHIESVVTGIFAAADDFDVEADKGGGFGIGDNHLRIHWLINNLLRERLGQAQRGQIIEAAARTAAIGWLMDLSRRCTGEHVPGHEERDEQREPMVEAAAAERVAETALTRLRAAVADGTLATHRRIRRLLWQWKDVRGDAEVRQWTDTQLANDAFIVNFAERSIGHSWSQGMGMFGLGDTVARRQDHVHLEPFSGVLDLAAFRRRVTELLARADLPEDDRQKLERFRATPERNPEQDD